MNERTNEWKEGRREVHRNVLLNKTALAVRAAKTYIEIDTFKDWLSRQE